MSLQAHDSEVSVSAEKLWQVVQQQMRRAMRYQLRQQFTAISDHDHSGWFYKFAKGW